jgi:putative membrane protein insertion efficiency factor
VIVGDAIRAAGRLMVEVLIIPVRAYQKLLSPLLGNHCRFAPSCSKYAMEALRVHGVFRGSVLAAWRILRCNPLGRSGYDPVPPRKMRGDAKA